ncbi:hypothetical protein [Thalassospira sp. NFXS8]|uniref:hypothetical protein n=1 Tax=Thalassospira sp. NFXS8 TaxID=2819093 RepID=UPI0032DE463E
MAFWSTTKTNATQAKAQDIKWRAGPRGDYFRLYMIDDISELKVDGVGGVYLVWHGGVKPGWLLAGNAGDLGFVFRELREDRDIREYDGRGGVYISWSQIKDEYRDGVVHFLARSIKPVFECEFDSRQDAIPVMLPR